MYSGSQINSSVLFSESVPYSKTNAVQPIPKQMTLFSESNTHSLLSHVMLFKSDLLIERLKNQNH